MSTLTLEPHTLTNEQMLERATKKMEEEFSIFMQKDHAQQVKAAKALLKEAGILTSKGKLHKKFK